MLAALCLLAAKMAFVAMIDPWMCLATLKLFPKDVVRLQNAQALAMRPPTGFFDYAVRVWPRSTYHSMGIVPVLTIVSVLRYALYGVLLGPVVGVFGLIYNLVLSYQADSQVEEDRA